MILSLSAIIETIWVMSENCQILWNQTVPNEQGAEPVYE